MSTDITTAPHVGDLELGTITHEELESEYGSCAERDDDSSRHLLMRGHSALRARALIGGRAALRQFIGVQRVRRQ